MIDHNVGSADPAQLVKNLEALEAKLSELYAAATEPETMAAVNCFSALAKITRIAPNHSILRGGYRSMYVLAHDGLYSTTTSDERTNVYAAATNILEGIY